jgi:hypothetical protein
MTFLAVAPVSCCLGTTAVNIFESEVSIAVHDYADVPTALLGAAEYQAREIFRNAGLETVQGTALRNLRDPNLRAAIS